MERKELVAVIEAASAMPVPIGQPLLLQVLEQLRREPQAGVSALLVRSLGRMQQRTGNPNVEIALREAEALP